MLVHRVSKDQCGEADALVSSPGARKWCDVCFESEGQGQPNVLVVSRRSDRVLWVWGVKTGYTLGLTHLFVWCELMTIFYTSALSPFYPCLNLVLYEKPIFKI